MRDSLRKSLEDSPVRGFERFSKGSVVLCNACMSPIFTLDGGIAVGDKAGRMASRFKPMTLAQLDALAEREDIDAGLKAMIRGWNPDRRKEHIGKLREMHAGDPMLCPVCEQCFVQVLSVEKDEVMDKSYTVELVTVPPTGTPAPITGKQIGYGKDWVH